MGWAIEMPVLGMSVLIQSFADIVNSLAPSPHSADPLPSKHLHNTLAEFVPQFPPEFLPAGSNLGTVVPFEGEGADQPLGVDVEWVIAYTVVSRTRNVVRDKGYMISARLL